MGSHASPQPQKDDRPWRLVLARRLRRRAVLTGAAAAAFAVVAAFTYVSMTFALRTLGSSGVTHGQRSVGCATGTCGSVRAASAMPNFTVQARARSTAGSRHHRPSPSPTPSTDLAPAAQTPSSEVSVGFSASKKWHGGFEGHLTIVNHGSAVITSWRIAITLPKDHVTSVWDAVEQIDGDVLVLTPTSWDPPISPGGSFSMYFVARGPTSSPTSCTYNGSPCA